MQEIMESDELLVRVAGRTPINVNHVNILGLVLTRRKCVPIKSYSQQDKA